MAESYPSDEERYANRFMPEDPSRIPRYKTITVREYVEGVEKYGGEVLTWIFVTLRLSTIIFIDGEPYKSYPEDKITVWNKMSWSDKVCVEDLE
jgi:hypothetical protein